MTSELAEHIIKTIVWHRTWIAFKDFDTTGEFVMLTPSGQMSHFSCRLFRLEVRVPQNGYFKKQILNIPEIKLDHAIYRLSKEKAFERRVATLAITFEDVNRIFSLATEGNLPLELEK